MQCRREEDDRKRQIIITGGTGEQNKMRSFSLREVTGSRRQTDVLSFFFKCNNRLMKSIGTSLYYS